MRDACQHEERGRATACGVAAAACRGRRGRRRRSWPTWACRVAAGQPCAAQAPGPAAAPAPHLGEHERAQPGDVAGAHGQHQVTGRGERRDDLGHVAEVRDVPRGRRRAPRPRPACRSPPAPGPRAPRRRRAPRPRPRAPSAAPNSAAKIRVLLYRCGWKTAMTRPAPAAIARARAQVGGELGRVVRVGVEHPDAARLPLRLHPPRGAAVAGERRGGPLRRHRRARRRRRTRRRRSARCAALARAA